MNDECEHKCSDDFFDGLRCTKCTIPMFRLMKKVEGSMNLYEDISKPLD